MGFFNSIWIFVLSLFSLSSAMGPCSFDTDNGIITSENCFIDDNAFIFNLLVTNGATLLIKPNPDSTLSPKTNVSTNTILVNNTGNITIESEALLKGVKYENTDADTTIQGTLLIVGNDINDTQPPKIECDNCHDISGATITFNPAITDPDPSSGLKVMRICKDAICNNAICFSTDSKCSASMLTLGLEQCTFSNIEYWVYTQDNGGNFRIIKGGEFETKKGTGCICSFDEECYAGLCTGSPSTCSENPIPDIDLK